VHQLVNKPLIDLQLVKKLSAFYGTRRFITPVTTARHLPLSWASCIQSTPSHSTCWRSIVILSSHLRLGLPSGLFPSSFPTKTLYKPLLSPIRATRPAHLILLDFITRKMLGEEYRSLSSSCISPYGSKGNFVSGYITKTREGRRRAAPPILDPETSWKWVVSFTPRVIHVRYLSGDSVGTIADLHEARLLVRPARKIFCILSALSLLLYVSSAVVQTCKVLAIMEGVLNGTCLGISRWHRLHIVAFLREGFAPVL